MMFTRRNYSGLARCYREGQSKHSGYAPRVVCTHVLLCLAYLFACGSVVYVAQLEFAA
jgi:hypothetical protein